MVHHLHHLYLTCVRVRPSWFNLRPHFSKNLWKPEPRWPGKSMITSKDFFKARKMMMKMGDCNGDDLLELCQCCETLHVIVAFWCQTQFHRSQTDKYDQLKLFMVAITVERRKLVFWRSPPLRPGLGGILLNKTLKKHIFIKTHQGMISHQVPAQGGSGGVQNSAPEFQKQNEWIFKCLYL